MVDELAVTQEDRECFSKEKCRLDSIHCKDERLVSPF